MGTGILSKWRSIAAADEEGCGTGSLSKDPSGFDDVVLVFAGICFGSEVGRLLILGAVCGRRRLRRLGDENVCRGPSDALCFILIRGAVFGLLRRRGLQPPRGLRERNCL